jgi:hypothetical protein
MKQLVIQRLSVWQVRIVALAFIVLSVAGGSHMLVTAFAASTDTGLYTHRVATYQSISIPMHTTNPRSSLSVSPRTGTSHK